MKATESKLLDFLKKSPQFRIPIYQRTYSWTNRECEQLWNDILKAGKSADTSAHFINSIVYIEEGLYQVSSQSPLLVIDGQQRLTTVFLIIEALARHIDNMEPVEGFSARKLRNYYLLNPEEEKEYHYKLLLTQTDKDSLLALLDKKPWPEKHSIRIKENFEFFEKKIKELKDIKTLYEGLAKLIIVDIALDRDKDNPQLIFESMNSTGRELSQADLIRNFILMGLELKHQTELYENHWRPMEKAFGQSAYSEYFDRFIRDYLTMKTKEIPNIKKVYESFKKYARETKKRMDELITDIHTFANYYCAIALNKETNKDLKEAFNDLRELKVNVSYPFLLQVYDDYKRDLLSIKDFEGIVRLVESYVFRRAVCDIPTNSLNKTFANCSRFIKKEHYVESVRAHFLLQPSYRRFPKDREFSDAIKNRNLYNFRSQKYYLRKLENYKRKESVNVNEYTIEHILPQNENLSQKWKQALGENWKEIQEKYLHTLGNLTLTGYNSEYGDKFWTEKRDTEKGFKNSPLHLNEGLRQLDTWGEEEIKHRAEQLAQKALQVWSPPSLPQEVLENYRPKKQQTESSSYSIESYSVLKDKNMRSLFEAFQKEVLAFDPCVIEVFRKDYIAYKAEGNFVYVNPQTKKFRLDLIMNIHELHDPKGIANTNKSNRSVNIELNSLEKLPYVLSLVRQALEKQIGNEEIE